MAGSKRKELTGVVFGCLKGEAPINSDKLGWKWRFRCSGCGHAVVLSAAAIRQRFSIYKDRLACSECMRQERSTRIHLSKQELFKLLWETARTLYSAGWDRRMHDCVLDALEKNMGDLPPELFDPSTACELSSLWEIASGEQRGAGQRAAYFYPIGGDDKSVLWECRNCSEPFHRGLGCVLCVEPICTTCVRAEKHRCQSHWDDEAADGCYTLPLIGKEWDISKERVRGIEAHGLQKLRDGGYGRILRNGEELPALSDFLD